MQTSRKLIQKYYHVRVGHKLAGIIAQVDTISLMAARLLRCDFCAVFYRAETNTCLIPVAYQYGPEATVRGLDRLEAAWGDRDIDSHLPPSGPSACGRGRDGKDADDFAADNEFAARYVYPVHKEGRLCAVIVGYWRAVPPPIESDSEAMLDLLAGVLKAALGIADQLMVIENYSARMSELLPLFDVPLQEMKFSDLVTEVIARAGQICPEPFLLLFSRDRHTGRLRYTQTFGDHVPTAEMIAHVTREVEPIVLPEGDDPDGDTKRFRCRDLARPEQFALSDLVALPIAPGEDIQFLLVVGTTGEPGLSSNDRELLSVFAVFAQTVLRNALLVRRLRRANRLLERSSDRLASAETMAALTDMTSGVAHDFNNIFGAIIGRVQLLRLRHQDSPAMDAELGKIESLVSEGAETVRRIQEFATSGRTREIKPVDLAEVVRDAIAAPNPRWRTLAGKKGVIVRSSCDLDHAVMDGCRDDLLTVVNKLVENAVEHAPEGSAVVVALAADEQHYSLSVSDGGPGIAPEIRKKVFYPFFTTKTERGAGLGLAIVHGIVSRHSGTISFTCSADAGTVFTVGFRRPASLHDVTEITGRIAAQRENLRILVVDDDDQIREVLRDMLMINGHRAVACANGYEALEALEKEPFDLMITDLGMPGMSGLELAGAVHQQQPQLPIAMITGWGTQLDQREIAAKGVKAVLPKPFHLRDIRALVDEIAVG